MSTRICVNVLILQTASGAKLLILQIRPLLFFFFGPQPSPSFSPFLSISLGKLKLTSGRQIGPSPL